MWILTMKTVLFCLLALFSIGFSLPHVGGKGLTRSTKIFTSSKNYGILGGKPANIKNFPFVVSVTYDAKNLLVGSGAILNKNWIVCSAFEVTDFTPANISVRVGSSEADSGGQKLSVSQIIIHENYTDEYSNDVALLKVAGSIKLSKNVKPIKLATSTPKMDTKAKVVGYGMYTNNTNTFVSGQLQVANVQVSSKYYCIAKHGNLGDTCFCADADGVGPCYSDFGDPLVHNNQLLGQYLGGDICNLYGVPEIYSNIAKLRKWIISRIKKHSNAYEMQGIDDDQFYEAYRDTDRNQN